MPYITQAQLDLLKGEPTPAAAHVHAQLNVVKAQIQELQRHNPARRTEDEAFFTYTLVTDTTLFAGTYSNIYLAVVDHSPGPRADRARLRAGGPHRRPPLQLPARAGPHRQALARAASPPGTSSTTRPAGWWSSRRWPCTATSRTTSPPTTSTSRRSRCASGRGRSTVGMDYLGENGICHRSINPKHVLLTPAPDELSKTLAKLGSFRDAIIYLSVDSKGEKDNSRVRVRRPACRGPRDFSRWTHHFQAPETFTGYAAIAAARLAASLSMASLMSGASSKGVSASALAPSASVASILSTAASGFVQTAEDPPEAPEDFDPIAADVWSFAATFFYANARVTPLRVAALGSAGEDPLPAIQRTITAAPNLSADGKRWFSAILAADPSVRTKFEAAGADPWFTGKGQAISG
ncbi:hypothetical protein TYRP_022774 [Tyrophagus putrescentiae]|nr:hypothetical protein TYRP_022774 [Tyrophagus putrescentiae]